MQNSAQSPTAEEKAARRPEAVFGLTVVALLAFAGNSLLCRQALRHTAIDPATFTTVRIVSGALMLTLLARLRPGSGRMGGDWISAFALFAYAAAFSFAYLSLTAGAGALLLFGAVQATMIGIGLQRGERLSRRQTIGLLLALGGFVGLMAPGLTAPPLAGSALMIIAGGAWGIYSVRGKGALDPLGVTAGNFMRAVIPGVALGAALLPHASLDTEGFLLATASGALTSGVGYAVWYAALPRLPVTSAATAQLSVPVLTALGGVVLLGEPVGLRLGLASAAILGGIALVVLQGRRG